MFVPGDIIYFLSTSTGEATYGRVLDEAYYPYSKPNNVCAVYALWDQDLKQNPRKYCSTAAAGWMPRESCKLYKKALPRHRKGLPSWF